MNYWNRCVSRRCRRTGCDLLPKRSVRVTFSLSAMRFPGVLPGQRVPPDDEHVDKHLNAVPHHADLGGVRMSPHHWNFDRPQSVMPREVQQLWVKPKPLNGLLLKDDPAGLPPERLEPALGVHKRQPQDRSHNFVKDDSRKLAE